MLIDWFLPLKFYIPITVSLENYSANCIVIANISIDLAAGGMALTFAQELAWAAISRYLHFYPPKIA